MGDGGSVSDWCADCEQMPDVSEEARKELDVRAGFMQNTRRSTGYVFSEDALSAFLVQNNFSHVIRAHELQASGISVQFDGKLLTVFSTSHYCGGNNDAAVVMVESSKIRVIRMNSRNPPKAAD